jgi:hypothetical protein
LVYLLLIIFSKSANETKAVEAVEGKTFQLFFQFLFYPKIKTKIKKEAVLLYKPDRHKKFTFCICI